MSFLSLAAQGANLMAGVYSAQYSADAATALGQTQANVIGAQSEVQAQTDEFNAAVADQLAKSVEQGGAANAHDFKRAAYAKLAGARASRAAGGLDVSVGSPLMVDENTVSQIEFGINRIAYDASLSASRYRNQGTLYRTAADYARKYGAIASDAALQAGEIKAGAARLQGYGSLIRNFATLGTTIAGRSTTWPTGGSTGVNLGGSPLSLSPVDYGGSYYGS